MSVAYATTRDVYDLGLSARSFVVVPRPLDARQGDWLDAPSGTFWLNGHGTDEADLVWLVLIAPGTTAAPMTLPGGASSIVPYYPLPIDFRRFRLSRTAGGTAETFSDVGSVQGNGASAWGLLVDPERRLRRIIVDESGAVDQCLTAHATPLLPDPQTGKYPEKIVGHVARRAARRAIAAAMFENAAAKIASERLDAVKKDDDAQEAAWAAGQPIYPNPLDQTDGQPDNGGRGANRLTFAAAAGRCSLPLTWVRGVL